jgi:hypothetical protein
VTLESGARAPGSLEFVAISGADGRKSVRIKARMASGPVYLTNAILDGVGRKLRTEVGLPSEPPAPPPPRRGCA